MHIVSVEVSLGSVLAFHSEMLHWYRSHVTVESPLRHFAAVDLEREAGVTRRLGRRFDV